MKKMLCIALALIMTMTTLSLSVISGCCEEMVEPNGDTNVTSAVTKALYAHATDIATDSEAWVKWYEKDNKMYFFMPTATNKNTLQIYNPYTDTVSFNSTTIYSGQKGTISYEENKEYNVKIGSKTYKTIIMRSDTEAAVFINNPAAFDGKDLWTYLTDNKENEAKGSGAILDDKGNLDNTTVKKIKGRGNTSWDADKKGFNITYDDAVKVGTMQKCKKFSIISNFQDASLTRNRLLYDLSDEIGVPYASDSRFMEFYVNGEYMGNYQMCEKVDVGKNTLMPDIDDEDYLNYVNGTTTAFEFVCEIDSNPSDDDFTVRASNGNNLTMKAPELSSSDTGYQKVQRFIKAKYDVMWNKVSGNASDVNDYIDIESLAQVYLINELGKNWDAGAGSFFLVYKPDENGKYKFYASPVWDYDNSLGNAKGVEGDLNRLGIKDYEEPTGWFAKYKNGYRGPNFLSETVDYCDALDEMIPTVWFEQFVPAIENRLNGTKLDNTELYSADVYKSYLNKSAAMNYIRWDIVQEPQWVATHDSIKKCSATYTYNEFGQVTGLKYKQDTIATQYQPYSFDDEYQYMIDWTNSRAAWLSKQYFDSYTPSEITPQYVEGDADLDGSLSIMDATEIQLHLVGAITISDKAIELGNVDGDEDLTILDATQIQMFLVGSIDTL